MKYKILQNATFSKEQFSIVPIRYQDRIAIMQWRNEQIYHLRQIKPLTEEDQERYFTNVVARLFDQEEPDQLLFSYLENENCIGYGGLVHINWIDKNAEVSFIIKTDLEKEFFKKHWNIYLGFIEKVAFRELDFHKLYTYAFDLRPHLYEAVESAGFTKEAILKEHFLHRGEYKDVVIHSKIENVKNKLITNFLILTEAAIDDAETLFNWANEPNVRKNSIYQEPIIWENHLRWFEAKLKDPNSKIFILKSKQISIGQVRIDLVDGLWNIGFSIDAKFRGNGLGKQIIMLLLNRFDSYKFKAIVKKNNKASARIFNLLGFQKTESESSELECFQY